MRNHINNFFVIVIYGTGQKFGMVRKKRTLLLLFLLYYIFLAFIQLLLNLRTIFQKKRCN